jgi:hypothetical protein
MIITTIIIAFLILFFQNKLAFNAIMEELITIEETIYQLQNKKQSESESEYDRFMDDDIHD